MNQISVGIKELGKHHPEYEKVELSEVTQLMDGYYDTVFCNCFDYVSLPHNLLIELLKKIKIGGEIIIECGEILSICRSILLGIIKAENIIQSLYGHRRGTLPLPIAKEIFIANGFHILEQDVDDNRYQIRSKRI